MKHHILQLSTIARKRHRIILGLMSGTSLDGLDLALCRISGSGTGTKVDLLAFETMPYEEAFKKEIRKVFAKREIDFQHLTLLHAMIGTRHGDMVLSCLKKWGIPAETIDLIASHGQTVYHAPRIFHGLSGYPNATLQIGDGDHLSRRTGIITISDFRQKHVAAGGEGVRLALYVDYFLCSIKGETMFLLNIGGIANFTYLPGNQNIAKIFATDTGPGNTLLDAFAQELFGLPFDEDARLAANGRVDDLLMEILKSEPFFTKPLPKTIGPELFSITWAKQAISQLPKGNPNPYDVMATLTRLTADTIVEAILRVEKDQAARQSLYISGGGAHNPLILKHLKEKLPELNIKLMEKLGMDGDAKEAVLFAVLANETVAGRVGEDLTLGGVPMVGMGKVSFPG